MERIHVNTTGATDGIYSSTEESNTSQLEKGQVVEGVITKVSDKISITLNGKELYVSQSAVQDAKEGQVRTFEITDISKQSIVLREVGNKTEQEAPSAVRQTSVITGSMAAFAKGTDAGTKETLEAAKDKVKEQIKSALGRVSKSDYDAMSEEATPLEEYNEDRFDRMLNRVKKQRQFKSEHLKEEIEKKQDTRKEIEEATKGIKERLEEQKLPVTSSNIAKVANAMELASMAGQMSDGSKAYMIDNSLPVTPENIYKSIYSSTSAGTANISDSDWNELRPQVQEMLAKDGVEVAEETLSGAKWLLQNGLMVNKDTIAMLGQLDAISSDEGSAMMLDLIVKNLAEGGEPKKTNLPMQMEDASCIKKAAETTAMLAAISETAAGAVKEGEAVTIQSLYQASLAGSGNGQATKEIKAVTARRQLEEVRLKLTMENSYQLYKQGIEVNTTELSKLVESLRALEESYYEGLCKEYGVDATKEEAGMLKAADQMVAGLKKMPAAVLGSTLDARMSITLTQLYKEGEKQKSANKGKASEYETVMTVPRKDLGDSIKKAFQDVDRILDDLKMERTTSNERAVRILAYNQMEINEDSITNMKGYDQKVNQLIEKMTPEVTLQLIKQGRNPMDMAVNDLSDMVGAITDSLGETSEEKFSEYLYNLDRKHGITSEQRESYIGIYRLLHQVEKSDGAAVGAVVKANKELTLGNLLTAVRSASHAGMDIRMDESAGGVESIQSKGASISDQVGKAFYARALVKEAYDGLSVDAVEALEQKREDLLDATVEELCEAERDVRSEASSNYQEARFENMQEVFRNAKNADVLVYAGADVTVNSLEAADCLLAEGSSVYRDMKAAAAKADKKNDEKLAELYEGFYERIDSQEALQDGFGELSSTLNEAFERFVEMGDVTAEDVDKLRIYQNVIRLSSDLSKSRLFEIPVTLGEDVVTMKVQMVSAKEAHSSVSIHMADEKLGSFDMTATVEEGSLKAFVICDSRKVADYYEENKEALKDELSEAGVSVKQLAVTMNRKKTEFYDTQTPAGREAASTEVLYKVAKIFVANTKKAFQ